MKFPDYFADAEASFEKAEYIIFGIPYDKTGSFRRGTNKGPTEIRQASWNFETYDLLNNIDLKDIKIHDYGNLIFDKENEPKDMKKKVKNFTYKILDKDKIPLAIGGEHTVTYPIIQAFEKSKKDIAVIIFDAHLDYKDKYENNPESHACVVKRISEVVGVENIAVLGVRSGIQKEFDEAKKDGLLFINSFDINKKGIQWALDKVHNKFIDKDIYFSLDFDAIDPCYAPGTSTPEPFGLNPFDILQGIKLFSKKITGFDLVEVCPAYDRGETAILAARIIRYLITEVSLNKDG